MLAITLFMGNGTFVSASPANAPIVDILYEYTPNGARGASPPKNHTNLSNNTYILEGTFAYLVYTNYCFSADGQGQLAYDIIVDYDDFDMDDLPYNRQVSAQIEVWKDKIFSDELVYSKTFYADEYFDSNGYFDKVYCSDIVTGLDTSVDTHYYIAIYKTNDGMDATVSGSVSHP